MSSLIGRVISPLQLPSHPIAGELLFDDLTLHITTLGKQLNSSVLEVYQKQLPKNQGNIGK